MAKKLVTRAAESAREQAAIHKAAAKMGVLACPFCGCHRLDVGIMSGQRYGVQCSSCFAMVQETTPCRWPPKIPTTHKDLVVWTTLRAIKRWNARARPFNAREYQLLRDMLHTAYQEKDDQTCTKTKQVRTWLRRASLAIVEFEKLNPKRRA